MTLKDTCDRYKIAKMDKRTNLPPSTILPPQAREILANALRAPEDVRVREIDAAHRKVRELFPQFFQPQQE
jgi:hypothetical protein